MAYEIQPGLALAQIDAVVAMLHARYDELDTATQRAVSVAYRDMLRDIPPEGTGYQQGLVVVRFLQAIDALPPVHALVGPLIDAARGPVRRSVPPADANLQSRLAEAYLAPPVGAAPVPAGPPQVQPAPAVPPRLPLPYSGPATTNGGEAGAGPPDWEGLESAPPTRGGLDDAPTRGGVDDVSAPPQTGGAAQTLARFPHIEAPEQAAVGDTISVFVQLLVERVTASDAPFTFEDTGTAELPKVELVLRAPGCEIVGGNTRMLEIDRAGDSEERFVVIPRRAGAETLRVDFYQHGRRVGTIRHTLTVGAAPVAPPASAPVEQLDLTLTAVIPPPDLELCIEVDAHDGRTLLFELHSTSERIGYNHARVGSVTLNGSPLEKMQSVYAEMSRMARAVGGTPDEQRLATERLAAIGNQLWDELIPDELKRQFWRFRSRVASLLITSDEPWVPWEMLKPYRITDDGDREEAPVWCEQFAIARWLSGPCAADELPVGTARPVAPETVNLASVREEVAFIEGLGGLRADIVPLAAFSKRLQVLDWMQTGGFSVLHFACHGQFDATVPNDSAISLGDGPLRPSDIRAYWGKGPRPLVFINACHGGRLELSFTGLGGWADRLVKVASAGAFVGALWEVNDTLALQFARRFYTELLRERVPIAQAFQRARAEIRDAAPGNSTWLAYVLYADPLARVKQP